MATELKLRRGTTSQHSSFTGAEAEVTVDTDKETVVVHDGTTVGGYALAREDMSNVPNDTISGDQIAGGDATFDSINVDSGTLFVDSVNNRVGVGTSSPQERLDVAGDAEINGLTVGRGGGSGSTNTAVGLNALLCNTTGFANTAAGQGALCENTAGFRNTATGRSALVSNTTGSFNTATGQAALILNTEGNQNTATGQAALFSNTTGSFNTATGQDALCDNTTGSENTAIGLAALCSNTTASFNTAVGTNALVSNTTGPDNTATGRDALRSNTTGSCNTATGENALSNNTTGCQNTATGRVALLFNTTGSCNTATGCGALFSNTTGSCNTAFGHGAGSSVVDGSNNTMLGFNAEASSTSVSNEITLGDTNITNLRCNDTTISSLSDERDKDNIVDLNWGLQFIDDLRPVKFDWARRDGSMQGRVDIGFIAQELDTVQDKYESHEYTRLVSHENPDRLEADPMKTYPILIKAVQELSARVSELETQLANK